MPSIIVMPDPSESGIKWPNTNQLRMVIGEITTIVANTNAIAYFHRRLRSNGWRIASARKGASSKVFDLNQHDRPTIAPAVRIATNPGCFLPGLAGRRRSVSGAMRGAQARASEVDGASGAEKQTATP